ncbi:MAG: hypothetical protein D6712_14570 [Chloroflexi bacterium]|nr:MAG: hypothetical protein D6712_14570 [Chloroflexota bacterium]
MRRLGTALATAIVLLVGLVTLLGLLVGDNLGVLSTVVESFGLRFIAQFFVQVMAIVAAIMVLVGVFNLIAIHVTRVRRGGGIYSIALVTSFLAVVLAYMLNRQDLSQFLLEDVQISVESALTALLYFALVYGGYRVLHHRVTWSRVLFVITVLFVLVAALPLGLPQAIVDFHTWLMNVPVNAGARGILIGIALATIVTGVRVLIGQDRSYRE